jgi:hypothetical protein
MTVYFQMERVFLRISHPTAGYSRASKIYDGGGVVRLLVLSFWRRQNPQGMASTNGAIEIATRLWMLEDAGDQPSQIDLPSASAALESLLKESQQKALDRVLVAANSKADAVAQMAILRMRSAVNAPHIDGRRVAIFNDVIN